MCAHDITLAIWVNQIEMAFRYRAADPTDPKKWTCAQTSDQGSFGPDQQRDVAAPGLCDRQGPGCDINWLLIQNEKIKTLFWTVGTLD